jgi:hypothetical membrane protein
MTTTERACGWLNAGGIAAPVVWVAALTFSGSLHPEYSHTRQYISELAARGSSTQRLMQITGFMLPGLLMAGFGALVGSYSYSMRAGVGAALLIVGGAARFAAGLFPPDPCCAATVSLSHQLHNMAGLTYVAAFATATVVWSATSERTAGAGRYWFRWFSALSLVLAILVPVLLVWTGLADRRDIGLFQRVSFGILNVWLLAFAVSARGNVGS